MDQSGSRLQVKRGTRAKVDAAAVRGELLQGEPLLITDEGRLAVATSTNSYEPVAKQSEVTSSFKNKIINGGFDIWQRGTSFNNVTSFTADRWFVAGSSGINRSVSRYDLSLSERLETGLTYGLLFDSSAQSSFDNRLFQRIEGTQIAGKTVTISFWAKLVSGTVNVIYPEFRTYRDSTNYSTSGTSFSSVSIDSTLRRYSITGVVPETPSGTYDSLNANTLLILVRDNSANSVVFTGVQVEESYQVTSFEYRPVGMELALCQRYYYRVSSDYAVLGPAFSVSTNSKIRLFVPFPVTMRAAPAALEQTGTASNYGIFFSGAATACTAVPVHVPGAPWFGQVELTASSGHSAGQAGSCFANAANAYLGFSAEF